jgi:hypothetical protein
MTIVQIEHPISSWDAWKAAFDRDPIQREASGVRRYRIVRPVDDPNYIAVDLEFDDAPKAEAFRAALESMWRSPQAAAVLGGGSPRARLVEAVESREYPR